MALDVIDKKIKQKEIKNVFIESNSKIIQYPSNQK